MSVVRAFLILFCISIAASAQTKRTYMLSTELGCNPGHAPGSKECFDDVTTKIRALPLPAGSVSHSGRYITHEGGASLYSFDSFAAEMPSDVTITIHGLYENALQLNSTLDGPSEDRTFGSAIEMTLPGHYPIGFDTTENEKLDGKPPLGTAEEWVSSLDSTMKIAKTMGKRVHIVSQSTGGALAVLAALKYPDQVSSLVLYEPALEVQVQWSFLSCKIGGWITDSKRVRSTLIKHDKAFVNAENMRMGCQVKRLLDSLYQRYAPNAYLRASKFQAVAKQIHVPVYVINNAHDDVVSTSANRIFYAALPGWKRYQEINQAGKEHHGQVGDHAGVISSAIAETRAFGVRDPDAKAMYAYNAKAFFNLLSAPPEKSDNTWEAGILDDEQAQWAAKARDHLRDGDVVRRVCQFVRGDCASMRKTLADAIGTLDAFDSLVPIMKDRKNLAPAVQNMSKSDMLTKAAALLAKMTATADTYVEK